MNDLQVGTVGALITFAVAALIVLAIIGLNSLVAAP
jgi:hypothetical protein